MLHAAIMYRLYIDLVPHSYSQFCYVGVMLATVMYRQLLNTINHLM